MNKSTTSELSDAGRVVQAEWRVLSTKLVMC